MSCDHSTVAISVDVTSTVAVECCVSLPFIVSNDAPFAFHPEYAETEVGTPPPPPPPPPPPELVYLETQATTGASVGISTPFYTSAYFAPDDEPPSPTGGGSVTPPNIVPGGGGGPNGGGPPNTNGGGGPRGGTTPTKTGGTGGPGGPTDNGGGIPNEPPITTSFYPQFEYPLGPGSPAEP
jgi:hypothetical protein